MDKAYLHIDRSVKSNSDLVEFPNAGARFTIREISVPEPLENQEAAQVCSGGVDTSQVNPETLESVLHKGLYFAGELLDIDGPCGGYNLQWAWSSGVVAGRSSAKENL